MTQMIHEIRTLITALYDDLEDFLTGPHEMFGGRRPGELLATEDGQLELLRFLRAVSQGMYMPPNEIDRNFKPYTDADIRITDEQGCTAHDHSEAKRVVAQDQHKAPGEVDRTFGPYTAMNTDSLVDRAIAHLEEQIEQLRSLKGCEPEVAMVIGRAHEVFGDLGMLWLLEYHQVLQATPLDLVVQGRAQRVLMQLGRIEYGVPV